MAFLLRQLGWRLIIGVSFLIALSVSVRVAAALGGSGATVAAWGLVALVYSVIAYQVMFDWLEDAGRVRSTVDIYRDFRTGRRR